MKIWLKSRLVCHLRWFLLDPQALFNLIDIVAFFALLGEEDAFARLAAPASLFAESLAVIKRRGV